MSDIESALERKLAEETDRYDTLAELADAALTGAVGEVSFDDEAREKFGNVGTDETPFYLGFVAPGRLGLSGTPAAYITHGSHTSYETLVAAVGDDGVSVTRAQREFKDATPLPLTPDHWTIVERAVGRLASVNTQLATMARPDQN